MMAIEITTGRLGLARLRGVSPHQAESDWHLRGWMKHLGRKQADLVRDLGWEKARASKVYNSRTEYRRETVNELASWLGIQPFELLMRPEEAMALRQLRETAAIIVSGR